MARGPGACCCWGSPGACCCCCCRGGCWGGGIMPGRPSSPAAHTRRPALRPSQGSASLHAPKPASSAILCLGSMSLELGARHKTRGEGGFKQNGYWTGCWQVAGGQGGLPARSAWRRRSWLDRLMGMPPGRGPGSLADGPAPGAWLAPASKILLPSQRLFDSSSQP